MVFKDRFKNKFIDQGNDDRNWYKDAYLQHKFQGVLMVWIVIAYPKLKKDHQKEVKEYTIGTAEQPLVPG